MILAIDVGNTNIVLGCTEDGNITNVLRVHTNQYATAVEHAIVLRQVLEFYKVDPLALEGTLLSSVVPAVTEALTEAIKRLTGKDCLVVGPGMKTGMNVRIDDPGTLAGDLVVGSVAAMGVYGTPVLVLDMGTATTLSVIDEKKRYRGGVIMTGVAVSTEALAARTAQLPRIAYEPPKSVIGTNTVDCMKSGVMYANACALDGMVERLEEELGSRCTVVATGGLAGVITPLCRREMILDDDLLLKGLCLIYEKNR